MTAVTTGTISARHADQTSMGDLWNVCGTRGAVVASGHVAVHAAWHASALTETVTPDATTSA